MIYYPRGDSSARIVSPLAASPSAHGLYRPRTGDICLRAGDIATGGVRLHKGDIATVCVSVSVRPITPPAADGAGEAASMSRASHASHAAAALGRLTASTGTLAALAPNGCGGGTGTLAALAPSGCGVGTGTQRLWCRDWHPAAVVSGLGPGGVGTGT